MDSQILENSVNTSAKYTLYINNINEKINLDELKINLFHLFSEFGEILEINSRKTLKMKGQSFITFRSRGSALKAKASLNGYLFFGKKLAITYSKTENDKILLINGELTENEKIKKDLQRKREREKEYQIFYEDFSKNEQKYEKKIGRSDKEEKNKFINNDYDNSIPVEEARSNNVLLVEIEGEIEEYIDYSEKVIKIIFSKFTGFKSLKFFPDKKISLVEYDNNINSGAAMFALNGYKLTNEAKIKISFAKK